MQMTAEFQPFDFFPKWNGRAWSYQGRRYLSLRHMKTRPSWKLEERLTRRMIRDIKNREDRLMIGAVIADHRSVGKAIMKQLDRLKCNDIGID